MEYFETLRLHLEKQHPDYFVSGKIEPGRMDYTYFYFTPKSLKTHKLKIVILFIHGTFEVQILLAGYNKSIQEKYWRLFKENNWNKYHLVATTRGVDSILDCVLVGNPDFSNLDVLTEQIEAGALKFIGDVEGFLSVIG